VDLGGEQCADICCRRVLVAVLSQVGGEAPGYGGREGSVGSQAEGIFFSLLLSIDSPLC
jgi:hypothetical protein